MLTIPLLELLTREKSQAFLNEARSQQLLWELRKDKSSYWQRSKNTLGSLLIQAGQQLQAEQAVTC